ncbi:outer membrane protein assembly factor BamE domain-containing protein [Marinobacter salicampi]|uniref:outer membrane protein assembly factor BamE domain-containing protein n=1 Tax=Marinobacter salicampi TaxID=435907 RepID=UPI001F5EEBA4|nr:outer membrane protein assembly factor BamE [Marinobacter salicampi]
MSIAVRDARKILAWSFAGLIALTLAMPASAIYRCGSTFSDQPCGPDAEEITVRDNHIGGNFESNLPELAEPAPDTRAETGKSDQPEDACRFISSTDLRTHLARNQVVKGMTRDQVLKAFGRPPETYPVPRETWVYQTDYYGKLYELTYVYFRDGCVDKVEYRKP